MCVVVDGLSPTAARTGFLPLGRGAAFLVGGIDRTAGVRQKALTSRCPTRITLSSKCRTCQLSSEMSRHRETARPLYRDVRPASSNLGGRHQGVASGYMSDQSLSDQAREAVLKAIIQTAPTVGNSPSGIRDLAEAYALLERDLIPRAGVVQSRT